MGCEQSNLIEQTEQHQLQSVSENQQFTLAYRQFITNTAGNIFKYYHFSTVLKKSPMKIIRKVIHKHHGEERICKIVHVSTLPDLAAMMEVEILKQLQHPNIVKIHEYFIQKNHLFIVYENIQASSLLHHLQRGCTLSHHQIVLLLKQLLLAVSHCYSNEIAHRRINPQNLLVNFMQNDVELTLIGFGQAEKINNPKKMHPFTEFSNAYQNLEVLTNPSENDIYCCGLILFTLLNRSPILPKSRIQMRQKAVKYFEEYPENLIYQNLLLRLLQLDPSKRIKAQECLEDPMFSQKNVKMPINKVIFENMLGYNIKGRLKSILWMFAAVNLKSFVTPQLIMEFHSLDENRDGKIDFQQLTEGLRNTYGISREKAEEYADSIFQKLDKNKNYLLDFYEFVLGSNALNKQLSEEQLQILFKQLDKNNDQTITSKDLNACISGIEEFKLLEIKKERITYPQFRALMNNYVRRMSEADFQHLH